MKVTLLNRLTGASRFVIDDVVVDSILLVLEKPHVSPTLIDAAAFPLLNSIDPYGVTLFNRYQMTFFLAEWERLKPTLDTKEQEGWSLIKDAAEDVAGDQDLFLEFLGD